MMTEKSKEKISAFLDSAIDQDELMSFSLSSEPEDAILAQRYQMVGDAMRGELSESSFVDVSQAVRQALANENIAEQVTHLQANIESSSQSESRGWNLTAWFRPAAGMAVAASVAVVMVVTFSEQQSDGFSPVADNVVMQPAVMTADVNQAGVKPVAKNAEEMTPYINQHLEYATQDTLQGRLPFVRAVSYGSEK